MQKQNNTNPTAATLSTHQMAPGNIFEKASKVRMLKERISVVVCGYTPPEKEVSIHDFRSAVTQYLDVFERYDAVLEEKGRNFHHNPGTFPEQQEIGDAEMQLAKVINDLRVGQSGAMHVRDFAVWNKDYTLRVVFIQSRPVAAMTYCEVKCGGDELLLEGVFTPSESEAYYQARKVRLKNRASLPVVS